MVVPFPFSRAIFLYGDPLVVPRDADSEEMRLLLEQRMNTLADEAETRFEELWDSSAR